MPLLEDMLEEHVFDLLPHCVTLSSASARLNRGWCRRLCGLARNACEEWRGSLEEYRAAAIDAR